MMVLPLSSLSSLGGVAAARQTAAAAPAARQRNIRSILSLTGIGPPYIWDYARLGSLYTRSQQDGRARRNCNYRRRGIDTGPDLLQSIRHRGTSMNLTQRMTVGIFVTLCL